MGPLSRVASAVSLAVVVTGCGADARNAEAEFLHGAGGVNTATDSVLLRDISIDEPPDGRYESGDTAVLNVTFVADTAEPLALTDVDSPVAGDVRVLSDPRCDGGARAVDRLPIQPQPTVRTPGRTTPDGPEQYYVILLRLDTQLRSGESVPVTFRFDNGETARVRAPVELAGEMLDVDDDLDCEPRD